MWHLSSYLTSSEAAPVEKQSEVYSPVIVLFIVFYLLFMVPIRQVTHNSMFSRTSIKHAEKLDIHYFLQAEGNNKDSYQ